MAMGVQIICFFHIDREWLWGWMIAVSRANASVQITKCSWYVFYYTGNVGSWYNTLKNISVLSEFLQVNYLKYMVLSAKLVLYVYITKVAIIWEKSVNWRRLRYLKYNNLPLTLILYKLLKKLTKNIKTININYYLQKKNTKLCVKELLKY